MCHVCSSPHRRAVPAVGRIRFKDLNSDGVINDDDKGAIGDAHPDFFGGINLGFDYKNFDLEFGYNINLPNSMLTGDKLPVTTYFNVSLGYLFSLN